MTSKMGDKCVKLFKLMFNTLLLHYYHNIVWNYMHRNMES